MKTKCKLMVFCIFLFYGCTQSKQVEEQVKPVYYQVVDFNTTKSMAIFSGVSQSAQEAKLSFKVGGVIKSINVEMGDTLKRGEIISIMDKTDNLINLKKAEANLKSAKAQLAASKSSFLRIENLFINNSATLSDYEKVKLQYESSLSLVKSAELLLEAARNQLDYTVLKAPFDGVVTSVLMKENEMSGSGNPVVIFASVTDIEVKINVPEIMVNRIVKGLDATIKFNTLSTHIYKGKITEISPGTPNASAFPVIIKVTNPRGELLPGMTCSVEISLLNDNVYKSRVIISTEAVGSDYTGHYVFIAEKSDEGDVFIAKKREIRLGELLSDGYEIVDGLTQGDVVITAGLSSLYHGRKVKLLEDKEKTN